MGKRASVQVFPATRPITVVPITVSVKGRSVVTEPERAKVQGKGAVIVWTLRDSRGWQFLGNGIAFHSDPESQFINAFRFDGGRRTVMLDRNTNDPPKKFKYTVSLYRKVKGKRGAIEVIHQDPIIENEGDGRSM